MDYHGIASPGSICMLFSLRSPIAWRGILDILRPMGRTLYKQGFRISNENENQKEKNAGSDICLCNDIQLL